VKQPSPTDLAIGLYNWLYRSATVPWSFPSKRVYSRKKQ